ncbi:MAG: hypothetical protein ACKOW9_00135 [Candidatus Paceibacterota bacterium]
MFRLKSVGFSVTFLLILIVLITSGVASSANESNQFGVGPELEQPSRYFIEGDVNGIVLRDLRYDHVIPFTGKVERVDDGVWVSTPELPQGSYQLAWDGGVKSFSIKGKHTYNPAVQEDSSIWLILLTGGFLLAIIVFLVMLIKGRGVKVSLAFFVTVLFLSGGGAVFSMDSSKPLPDVSGCTDIETFKEYFDCAFPALYEVAIKQPDKFGDYLKSQTINSHCHDTAHYVGFESYRRDLSLVNATQRATTACVYGVIHGTTEAIAVFSSDEEFPKNAIKFCSMFEDPTVSEYCIHGAGHATVMRTNGNLERALELCGPLTDGDHRCVGPALMEWMVWRNELRDPDKAKARLGGPDQPLEICSTIKSESSVRAACYEALHLANIKNPDLSVNWCLTEEKEFSVECFAGIGKDLHFWATYETPVAKDISVAVKIHKMCEKGNSDTARYECTWHLVRNAGIVVHDYERIERDLCQVIPVNHRVACRDSVIAVKAENQRRENQI